MAYFVLTSRPKNYLSKICAGWDSGTPLRTLVDGNVDGRLDFVNLPDDASDADPETYIGLECSFDAALAMMFWLAEQSPKGLKGLGVAFDRDSLIGAVAYKDGAFASMTVNEDDLDNLAREIIADEEDEGDYEDKNEYEQAIEELLYDQRIDSRDELQGAFIDYFTARVTLDGLDQVEPFKTLNHKGGTATLEILDDVIPQIKDRLSQKIDYYSFESMATLMQEQADEFWKDHRSRVREIMNSMPDELRGNKEFFRAVIPGVASWLLEYANETVRADREIYLLAGRADKDNNWGSTALEYASDSLKADREVVLEAVKVFGTALKYAAKTLKADREVVLAAVKESGTALEYAADSLKADREVVLEALKGAGYALQYASDSLKADREVALVAVKQAGWALQYADNSFKADREFMLEAVKHRTTTGCLALEYADDSLKADREFMLDMVKDRCGLQYADKSLKADREFMLEAVKVSGTALEYAADSLKADREVVLAAVKHWGGALQYASEELQQDKELQKIAEDVRGVG